MEMVLKIWSDLHGDAVESVSDPWGCDLGGSQQHGLGYLSWPCGLVVSGVIMLWLLWL